MKSKYYLISKRTIPFSEFICSPIRLSKEAAHTVDEVILGKKGRISKKITTFRDKQGRIIERCFNTNGEPLRNRIYAYSTNQISEDEFVNTTTIKEYSLKQQFVNTYNKFKSKLIKYDLATTLWINEKTQINHVAENPLTKTKTITISRNENLKNIQQQFQHSITQYHQLVENKIDKITPIKHLEYIVNPDFHVAKGSIKGQKVKLPKSDSFLGFRLLPLDDIRIPITERFMKERKIDKLGYKIILDYVPNNEENITWTGLFGDGLIQFSKKWKAKTKADFISTSRHEVEHGWQYYLDARNGGKRSEVLEELGKEYGPLTDPKLKAEADLYTEALDNYVPARIDYKKYRNNYIEKRAYEEGDKAKKEYTEQGKIIRNDFPHIPPELL